MYLLVTDETAAEPAENIEWFVYGGILLPMDNIPGLHQAIRDIRNARRFQLGDSLKFSTHDRPDHISHDEYTAAKNDVIVACQEHGVRFIADVVLHELARNQDTGTRIRWGANTVLGKFHEFLTGENETGIVMMDRLPFPHQFQYLERKFVEGLNFPNGHTRRMPRILGYSLTCNNASHLSSAIDVVLGAFRYCVNEPERDRVGRQLLPKVVKLMWYRQRGETRHVRGRGLNLRPQNIDYPEHQAKYDALVERLEGLLRPAANAA